MKIHILGSGTSAGVPVIGCRCPVCMSDDPRDKRTRASIALEKDGQYLLIETAPEMRLQLIKAGIFNIIGVVYTHLHADHTAGFDDLRAFSFWSKEPLPVYLFEHYVDELKSRYKYAFNPGGYKGAVPQLELKPVGAESFKIGPFLIEPMTLPHGSVETMGIRVDEFMYTTDFKSIPSEYIEKYKNQVKYMVARGIHFGQHSTHSTIHETIDWFNKLNVTHGFISHLSHQVSHAEDGGKLPDHVKLTFDGMVIDLCD